MKAARVCGRLRAELERQGQPLALADMQIVSIAISNNLTLVTGNKNHFDRILDMKNFELKIEDWL